MGLDTTWMNISSEEVYEILKDSRFSVIEFSEKGGKVPQPFMIMINQVDDTKVDLLISTYGANQYSKILDDIGVCMSDVVYKSQHGYDKWSTDRLNRVVSLIVDKLNNSHDPIACTVFDGMFDISEMRYTKFIKGTQLRPRVKITLCRTYHNHNLEELSNILIVK